MKLSLGLWLPSAPLTAAASPGALLSDNFNGGSLDGTKWTTGIGLVNVSGSVVATGQSAAQTGGQFVITATSTTGRGMSLISVANVDLTQNPAHFVNQVSSADITTNQGMAFGVPGSNVLHINRTGASGDTIQAGIRDNAGGFTLVANGNSARTIALWPWMRMRYVGGNLHVDFASPSASNPPIEADWDVDVINTTWPAGVSTTGKIGVFYFNEFGTTAGNFVWDGFNTGT